jgi:murein L,D-transpeptidase YafK
LCIVSTQLFASYDLVTIYKEKGIASVQNELDKQLATQDFWTNYLQNVDTSNGYYDSIDYTIVCKPDMKKINIFKNNKNEKVKIFESNIMTGKNNGAKENKGDLKTPIGAYDLINKLTKLDQFYGPLALVTSYPNSFDKINGRTGDGIWIHGVPLRGERDPSTKGCIALDNKNLELLDKSIDFTNSVLIIENNTTDINYSNKTDMVTILSNFYSWKNAWKEGDFEKYISFYSSNFKKTDGSDIKKFISYKKSIFDRKEEKQIIFKDLNIIPYPNEENKNMYKIKYYQIYSTKNYNFSGLKELYIEILDDKISILYEG